MKPLVNYFNESLVNESGNTVCDLYEGPETEKKLKQIFDKIKKGADKYAYLAGDVYAAGEHSAEETPDLAAVIKVGMDFLTGQLGSAGDVDFRDMMLNIFSGEYNEEFGKKVYDYCPDFDSYGVDLGDYTDMLYNNFNTYCKKVIRMNWD